MAKIETQVFTEVLLSEGAVRYTQKNRDGMVVALYVMTSDSKSTWILESDDYISNSAIEFHLEDLGLLDLMDRTFIDLF